MQIIPINDKKYPKLLKKIGKDAPKQLYYKGNWEDIFPARIAVSARQPDGSHGGGQSAAGGENCLAVVGSRRMTTYGKQVTEKLVGEIAAAGVTIVSGFMYGIDAAAHAAALNVGAKTIAVMPCGIDLIHPEYQQDLYAQILNNKGLIVSEYQGETKPEYWTYPKRNRIVAGLSRAVLVIEAGEKSGSLITAAFAGKYKRKVFAVPGPITSENSKGIMQLIKEGAEPINSARDVLKYYSGVLPQATPIRACSSPEEAQSHKGAEGEILEKLRIEPMNIDELSNFLKISAAELGTILSIMQLQGFIKEEGGKFHLNQ